MPRKQQNLYQRLKKTHTVVEILAQTNSDLIQTETKHRAFFERYSQEESRESAPRKALEVIRSDTEQLVPKNSAS